MRDIGIYGVEFVLFRTKRTVVLLVEMRCGISLGEDGFLKEWVWGWIGF